MSILMWLNPDGSQEQGRPLPDVLADLILQRRFYPNERRVAYRVRLKPK